MRERGRRRSLLAIVLGVGLVFAGILLLAGALRTLNLEDPAAPGGLRFLVYGMVALVVGVLALLRGVVYFRSIVSRDARAAAGPGARQFPVREARRRAVNNLTRGGRWMEHQRPGVERMRRAAIVEFETEGLFRAFPAGSVLVVEGADFGPHPGNHPPFFTHADELLHCGLVDRAAECVRLLDAVARDRVLNAVIVAGLPEETAGNTTETTEATASVDDASDVDDAPVSLTELPPERWEAQQFAEKALAYVTWNPDGPGLLVLSRGSER